MEGIPLKVGTLFIFNSLYTAVVWSLCLCARYYDDADDKIVRWKFSGAPILSAVIGPRVWPSMKAPDRVSADGTHEASRRHMRSAMPQRRLKGLLQFGGRITSFEINLVGNVIPIYRLAKKGDAFS